MPPPFNPPLSIAEIRDVFPDLSIDTALQPGGQGSVFTINTATSNKAVLKIYSQDTALIRIRHEIEALKEIESKYIVKLYDYGEVALRNSQLKFSIMEYISGNEATQLLAKLSLVEIKRALHDISLGIEILWDKRIVHRDIKPGNIIRRDNGDFVIIDLGIAKHLDRTVATKTGSWLGTRGYMSPEQAAGRRALTFKSDLFCLGILVYELASGNNPFVRNHNLINALRTLPSLKSFVSTIDDITSDIVDKLLQPFPLDRPRSCREVYSIFRR